MATYVINADIAGSGSHSIQSKSSSGSTNTEWLEARDGTGTFSVFARPEGSIVHNGLEFYAREGFLSFDTSILEGTVISGNIRMSRWENTSPNYAAETLIIRKYDEWSYDLSGTDWVPGADLSSLPQIATLTLPNTSGLIFSININNIDTTPLKLLLHEEKLSSTTTPPTSSSYVTSIHSPSEGTPPLLIVHTVEPSALMSVHDAAVQLSDGSIYYFEHDIVLGEVAEKKMDTAGTITTIYSGYDNYASLQSYAVCVDDVDNLYAVYPFGTDGLGFDVSDSSGTYIGSAYLNFGNNIINNLSAVWYDAGNGVNNAGRLFVVYAESETGITGYVIIDANSVLTNAGTISPVDSGTHPSFLVSDSNSLNRSGTGLSVTTDVFGGTNIGTFCWSTDVLSGTTVQNEVLFSKFVAGATISSIVTETLYDMDLYAARGKVVGVGTDSFVAVWDNEDDELSFKTHGSAQSNIGERKYLGRSPTHKTGDLPIYFDVVFDTTNSILWAYYWNESDGDYNPYYDAEETNKTLVRIPYYVDDQALGAIQKVDTVSGDNTFIRTVKHLRNSEFSHIHYNDSNNNLRVVTESISTLDPETFTIEIFDDFVELTWGDIKMIHAEYVDIFRRIGTNTSPFSPMFFTPVARVPIDTNFFRDYYRPIGDYSYQVFPGRG